MHATYSGDQGGDDPFSVPTRLALCNSSRPQDSEAVVTLRPCTEHRSVRSAGDRPYLESNKRVVKRGDVHGRRVSLGTCPVTVLVAPR